MKALNKIRGILVLTAIVFVGCAKEPEVGGNARIEGNIITRDYNSTFTQLIDVYPSEDVYVYITYGDHPGYDDRVKTDYDGQFQIENLYKGDYEVYVYSKDSTLEDPSGLIPVIFNLSITEKNQLVLLEDIIIYD